MDRVDVYPSEVGGSDEQQLLGAYQALQQWITQQPWFNLSMADVDGNIGTESIPQDSRQGPQPTTEGSNGSPQLPGKMFKYRLREFKTGLKWRPGWQAASDSRHRMQLAIYAKALQQLIGHNPDECVIEGIEAMESKQYAISDPRYQAKLVETMATVRNGVSDKQFQAAPYPAKCSMCPYGSVCTHSAAR